MKKRVLFILLLGFMIFIPKNVFAQEYTFEIGNGKEWNANNIEELQGIFYDMVEDDYNDDQFFNNTYILNFADGDYDFTYNTNGREFYGPELGNVIYNFGKGNYRFDYLEVEDGSLTIQGSGSNVTNIFTDELFSESFSIYKDVTINSRYFEFESEVSDELCTSIECSSNQMISMENVVFNVSEEDESEFEVYSERKVYNIYLNNVLINGVSEISFALYNYDVTIKNSDFSNIALDFYSESDNKSKIAIENSKLNKVVAYSSDIFIDCNCSFVNGISRVVVNNYNDFGDAYDTYTLIEFNENPEMTSSIITSICKNQSLNVKAKMSLERIKEEFGYDIDDTWDMDTPGIIKIEDGKIIALKKGTVKLSKEIDGELKVLTINVTDTDLVNPLTGRNLLFIISIMILVIFGTIFVKYKEKRC